MGEANARQAGSSCPRSSSLRYSLIEASLPAYRGNVRRPRWFLGFWQVEAVALRQGRARPLGATFLVAEGCCRREPGCEPNEYFLQIAVCRRWFVGRGVCCSIRRFRSVALQTRQAQPFRQCAGCASFGIDDLRRTAQAV